MVRVWFELLFPHFKRLHDMRVSILSLSSLYHISFEALPTSIREQLKNITISIMKLIFQYEETKSLLPTEEDNIQDDDDDLFFEDINLTGGDDQSMYVFGDDEDINLNIKKLVQEAKNEYKDNDSEDEYRLEDDKEFTSLLEAIDVVEFFVESFIVFSQRDADVCNSLVNSLNNEERQQLEIIREIAKTRL